VPSCWPSLARRRYSRRTSPTSAPTPATVTATRRPRLRPITAASCFSFINSHTPSRCPGVFPPRGPRRRGGPPRPGGCRVCCGRRRSGGRERSVGGRCPVPIGQVYPWMSVFLIKGVGAYSICRKGKLWSQLAESGAVMWHTVDPNSVSARRSFWLRSRSMS